ncbi:MAG: topoisomerase [Haliea sp.]|nr:topoisomerase [Haliea sp.]
MTEVSTDFRDAIRAAGLEPPDYIEPGRLHRFPGYGKGPSNRAGWCKLFDDCRAGCFGDWSSGLSTTWFPKQDGSGARREKALLSAQIEAAKSQAARSQRNRHLEAASRARKIWDTASSAPVDHAYLAAKSITAHNARIHNGWLVLPVTDFRGFLSSLQFIAPDGRKRLLSGGRKQGCFIAVGGNEGEPQRVIICEGWATGCTLAEDDPGALVLAAIDAGNLMPVATEARCRWPSAELVIAGDDDRLSPGNPGATKAVAAAIASDALVALPEWPADAPERLTDFNDLAQWLKRGDA